MRGSRPNMIQTFRHGTEHREEPAWYAVGSDRFYLHHGFEDQP